MSSATSIRRWNASTIRCRAGRADRVCRPGGSDDGSIRALIPPTRIRNQVSREPEPAADCPTRCRPLVNLHLIRPRPLAAESGTSLPTIVSSIQSALQCESPTRRSQQPDRRRQGLAGRRARRQLPLPRSTAQESRGDDRGQIAGAHEARARVSFGITQSRGRKTGRQTQRLRLLSAGLCILLLALAGLAYAAYQKNGLSRSRELASYALKDDSIPTSVSGWPSRRYVRQKPRRLKPPFTASLTSP